MARLELGLVKTKSYGGGRKNRRKRHVFSGASNRQRMVARFPLTTSMARNTKGIQSHTLKISTP